MDLLHKSCSPHARYKSKDYMNPKERAHFKKILEALKEDLSQDIDRTVHAIQDGATVSWANSRSRRYRRLKKAAAMLLPSVPADRSVLSRRLATLFQWCAAA